MPVFSVCYRYVHIGLVIPFIHHHDRLIPTGVAEGPEPIPETGVSGNQPRVGANTPQGTIIQPHTNSHNYRANLDAPISLWCTFWPVRGNQNPWDQTQDLFALRQQCYPLRYQANFHISIIFGWASYRKCHISWTRVWLTWDWPMWCTWWRQFRPFIRRKGKCVSC